jgi:hypothetical protein
MNKDEVIERAVRWLKAQSLEPVTGEAKGELFVPMQNEVCSWSCRVLCEDNPPAIHFLSRLPAKVPAEKMADTARLVLSMNRRIRFGQLSLAHEDRTITYRLSMFLNDEAPLEKQFHTGLHHTLWYVKENFGFLLFFIFDGEFHRSKAQYHLTGVTELLPPSSDGLPPRGF